MTAITQEEALHAFRTLGRLLQDVYNVDVDQLLDEVGVRIPCHVFRSGLSPFASVATYLSQEGFSPKHIARLLQRNKTFVTKSIHDGTDLETTGQAIPVSIYTDELSILEATCHYLRGKGLTNGEIADALGKSTSTIWVTLERADDKLA